MSPGSVGFLTTTLSAVSFPTLPSLATVTLPFSSTVMSLSVNPNPGFAALIASFTACFSSSVNASLFATGTLIADSLIVNSSAGDFAFTTLSAVSFPTLPSLATVTLPFLSTVMSLSVNPNPGFAALIASFTACFSASVNASLFATGTLISDSLIANSST